MNGDGSAKESEQTTRRARIDPQLAAQGWTVVPFEANLPLSASDHKAVAEKETSHDHR